MFPEALEQFTDRLNRRCTENPWCRECAREVENRTESYENAVRHLTPEQQDAVERYIAACEEMEYSRVFVAYQLGKEDSSI